MKFSNELKGTLFVLLAAVCWSINSPIVKYLTLFSSAGYVPSLQESLSFPFCGSGKSRKTVTCRCTSFHIPHFALP